MQTDATENWEILAIRILDTEKEEINKAAKGECRSMSSWVRLLILRELERIERHRQ